MKILILDRIMYQDGLRGDRYGPYDTTQREYEQHKHQEGLKHKNKTKQKIEKIAKGSYRGRQRSLEDEISESDEE